MPRTLTIVKAVIEMSRSLGISVTAEGYRDAGPADLDAAPGGVTRRRVTCSPRPMCAEGLPEGGSCAVRSDVGREKVPDALSQPMSEEQTVVATGAGGWAMDGQEALTLGPFLLSGAYLDYAVSVVKGGAPRCRMCATGASRCNGASCNAMNAMGLSAGSKHVKSGSRGRRCDRQIPSAMATRPRTTPPGAKWRRTFLCATRLIDGQGNFRQSRRRSGRPQCGTPRLA